MAGSGTAHLRSAEDALLRVENLVVEFPVGRTGLKVNAVSNLSIDVMPGETLGLVGESGCGKSTMGKAIMRLVNAQSGSVRFEGTDLMTLKGDDLRALRPKLQMIFQDPISSLNPRRRVNDIVREGLDIWKVGDKTSRQAKVAEVLETVGIDPSVAGPKRPHEFSGGQCQRISIARAVATDPKLIICDEPVSALDVSVQAQILNLLEDMKARYGLTMVFIAHDLAVVKNVSDRVAVMYLGKMCEFGNPDELFAHPAHPYTAALLSAIPEPDPEAHVKTRDGVGGEIPSPVAPPSGCRFRTRCPNADEQCASEEPQMREVRPAHFVACHHPIGDVTFVTAPAAESASAPVPPAPEPPPWTPPAVETPAAPEPVAPVAMAAPIIESAVTPPPPPVTPVPAPPLVESAPEPPAPPVIPVPGPTQAEQDSPWIASSPVSPDAPEVPAPAPQPSGPPPVVDWTPEARTPAVSAAAETAAAPAAPAPPPVAAAAVQDAAPAPEAPVAEDLAPPASEIPDVTSLDTLLPDRSKGGSIDPRK